MVATAFPLATKAGVEMLRKGGNAVDAACASAFALGVCEPQASGLGGESKALVHIEGETIVIDGSSRAPGLLDSSAVDKSKLSVGYKGATVPSTVAVLGYLHKRFGRLAWEEILMPAIDIAGRGYLITKLQHDLQIRELSNFKEVPSLSGARYFLKPGSVPYEVGERFAQPELASLLKAIAEKGPEHFYQGEPARRIDEDMKANGGFLRYEDLRAIPWPVVRKPLWAAYRGHEIATIPPSSGGRMLLFTLNALNHLPSDLLAGRSPETCRLLAEVFKEAIRSNEASIPIPDAYYADKDPMLSDSSTDKLKQGIPSISDAHPQGETTHLSVMDSDGNAVGITQSIDLVYGGKAAAEGLGFLYNNYLIDMNRDDPAHPHHLKPGSPSSSYVAPALVFSKGEPWILVGSPGSLRIFTTVVQFLSNVLDRNMTIDEAMREPRLHCTAGGCISIEADRFPASVIPFLREKGYELDMREAWSFYLGAIHAVVKLQSVEGFQGVAEVRRDGTAEGL